MKPSEDSHPYCPLRGLLIAQFFGAFNDNAWKLMVVFLAIKPVASEVGGSGQEFEAASQAQTTLTFVGHLEAQIDGLVAHLYGLSEDEFSTILKDLAVPDIVRVEALTAYRDVAKGVRA